MGKTLEGILDWSEVWATLIPLIVYIIKKPKANWIKPILIYLLFALFFSLLIDVSWKTGTRTWSKSLFSWLYRDGLLYNVIFYNLFSLTRVILLIWFFMKINSLYKKFYYSILIAFILFFILNFILWQDIMEFSSRQLTLDAGILLIFCLTYFYKVNLDDSVQSPLALPQSWIIIGLTLYTAVNFFIFLFFSYLTVALRDYAINIWNVHNCSYILLNLFIAVSFWKVKNKVVI
jgi:hypothetical protein